MKSPPKRATKEEVRARYHGMHDHIRSTGFEATWIGFQAVVIAVGGALFDGDASARASMFAISIVLLAAAIGIARAAEWARWVGGVASLLLAACALVMPFLGRAPGEEAGRPKYLFVVIGLTTGIYLLLPSTREAFRNARDNRELVRAARARA